MGIIVIFLNLFQYWFLRSSSFDNFIFVAFAPACSKSSFVHKNFIPQLFYTFKWNTIISVLPEILTSGVVWLDGADAVFGESAPCWRRTKEESCWRVSHPIPFVQFPRVGGGGGVLIIFLGGGVPPGPENPYPITDQNTARQHTATHGNTRYSKNGIPDQTDGIFTQFQTKMAKSIPYFRLEMLDNGTLWGGTYLYGLYMRYTPHPNPPGVQFDLWVPKADGWSHGAGYQQDAQTSKVMKWKVMCVHCDLHYKDMLCSSIADHLEIKTILWCLPSFEGCGTNFSRSCQNLIPILRLGVYRII